jgi:hypothetical protein
MKKLSVILIVLGLMLAMVPTVLADDDTTGEITITGSAVNVTTNPILLEQVALDGTDAVVHLEDPFTATGYTTGTYTGFNKFWEIVDPRGTGAGWSASIYTEDFAGVAGPALAKTATIPLVGTDAHFGISLFRFRLTQAEILWYDGQFTSSCAGPLPCGTQDVSNSVDGDLLPDPSGTFAAWTDLDDIATPQQFIAAPVDNGMGTYHLMPEFELTVPAETYAGLYRTNIYVTLTAAGPDASYTTP